MANSQYKQVLRHGPFPQQIDPWAEKGHYFHQLHGQMISLFLHKLLSPLEELGYYAGREASLQVMTNLPNLPDVFIVEEAKRIAKPLNYQQAVISADLELGTLLENPIPELDRLFIRADDNNELVTVIEIVSPNNKIQLEEIERYELRRKMLSAQGVHCVEIDLTRSVKRLIANAIAKNFPYHIAIHLNDGESRLIGMRLNDRLKSFALPLRSEILPIDLDAIYRQAYQETSMPTQILRQNAYREEALEFPSLLSDDEKKSLLAQVEAWKAALEEASP